MPSAYGGAVSPHSTAQSASSDVRSAIDKRLTPKSERTVVSWLHELTPQGKIKKAHRYMVEGYDKYLDAMKYMHPDEHQQISDAIAQIVEASKKVRAHKGILPKNIQVRIFGGDNFITPEQFVAMSAKFREFARTTSDAVLLDTHRRQSDSEIGNRADGAFPAQPDIGYHGIDIIDSITSQTGFELADALQNAGQESGEDDSHQFGTMEQTATFLAHEANVEYVGLYFPGAVTPTSSMTSSGSDSEIDLLRSPRTMPGGFSELESFATAVFEIRSPSRT